MLQVKGTCPRENFIKVHSPTLEEVDVFRDESLNRDVGIKLTYFLRKVITTLNLG